MPERSSTRLYGVRVINPDTGAVCWVSELPHFPVFRFSAVPRPFCFQIAWFIRNAARRFYPSARVVGLK